MLLGKGQFSVLVPNQINFKVCMSSAAKFNVTVHKRQYLQWQYDTLEMCIQLFFLTPEECLWVKAAKAMVFCRALH